MHSVWDASCPDVPVFGPPSHRAPAWSVLARFVSINHRTTLTKCKRVFDRLRRCYDAVLRFEVGHKRARAQGENAERVWLLAPGTSLHPLCVLSDQAPYATPPQPGFWKTNQSDPPARARTLGPTTSFPSLSPRGYHRFFCDCASNVGDPMTAFHARISPTPFFPSFGFAEFDPTFAWVDAPLDNPCAGSEPNTLMC